MREHWNERYRASVPAFAAHPLAVRALASGAPDGPVLELACGPSGSALALAAAGREVTAVDVAEVALDQLAEEAVRRGLSSRVRCVHADVTASVPDGRFALVLATRFWDAGAFRLACGSVAAGGMLGWEALAVDRDLAGEPPRFRVRHGELGARLASGFTVLAEEFTDDGRHSTSTLLARRATVPA